MRRRTSSYSYSLILIIILGALICSIPTVSATNDEQLAISEGTTYVWTIQIYDIDKYVEAYGSPAVNVYQGYNTHLTVEYISKGTEYWDVEVEMKSFKNNPSVKPIEGVLSVAINGANYSIGAYFIRIDAETFLSEWTPTSNYAVDGLNVIYNITIINVTKVYTYQSDGILSSITETYKGEEIYKMIKTSNTISYGNYFLLFSILGLLSMVMIVRKRMRGVPEK